MRSPSIYPATVTLDEAGYFLVTFPDVPEAGTDARDRDEALKEAQDALIAALGGYIELQRDIPIPSVMTTEQVAVYLPPLVAAKLALYQSMRALGMTPKELAQRLAVSEAMVQRLLDLDHRSAIGQIEAALAKLGQRLIVSLDAA